MLCGAWVARFLIYGRGCTFIIRFAHYPRLHPRLTIFHPFGVFANSFIVSICGACYQHFQLTAMDAPFYSFAHLPRVAPGANNISLLRSFFTLNFNIRIYAIGINSAILQVGEIVQLADTFLLTTRYPTEAVNPPSIKIRPPVLKKSFRFMVLASFHFAVHDLPVFQLTGVDAPFYSLRSFTMGKTRGYQYFTPSELFFHFSLWYSVSLCVLCG